MAGIPPAEHMGRSMDTDPACDGLASAYVESAYESNRPSLHRYLTSVTRDAALAEPGNREIRILPHGAASC